VRKRLILGAGAAALSCAVLGLVGLGPRVAPIAALVFVVVLVLGAVQDTHGGEVPPWPDPAPPDTPAGGERHLAAYVRMLESNETAASPEPRTRDALRRLCDVRLARKHRLSRADPAARELLGDDLVALLDGPPRRIGRARLDAALRRIESL
jgi:hypothetical protein